METIIREVPFAPRLTLVAALQSVGDRQISATGIAKDGGFAMRLAQSEIQERAAEAVSEPEPGLYGCGTGASFRTAAERACTEALERLAVHRWWYEGARIKGPSPNDTRFLEQAFKLYNRTSPRRTHIAELAYFPSTQVMLVWSHDQYGRGICLGYGASQHRGAAIRKALRELVQMEFSLGLIGAKLRVGVPLTVSEKAMWARAVDLTIDIYPSLWAYEAGSRPDQHPEIKLKRLRNPIGPLVVVRASIHSTMKSSKTRALPGQWTPY